MNYSESLEYIHSLLRFGINPGLERVEALLAELGNPQNSLKFVHVAGTNGKGSACTMLSEILRASGLKVGLFTSPYVLDFRERIQTGGVMISEENLAELASKARAAAERLAEKELFPTEFEFITAMAMKHFADNKCDIVVLEVGLGGRLDSTNIIETPEASVVMSISLDHTAVLGSTVEEIAAEKSGIIKPGGRTVCYCAQDEKAEKIIRTAAEKADNTYYKSEEGAAKIIFESLFGTEAEYDGIRFKISLPGAHQVNNAQTVIDAVRVLRQRGYKISDENIKSGLSAARIPARLELFGKGPLTLLDGAHNREGVEALSAALKKFPPRGKIITIMGMMEDKEYDFAVKQIASLSDSFTAVLPSNPRAAQPEKIIDIASKYCGDCGICPDANTAYHRAYAEAMPEDLILVCGSLYLASDVRGEIAKINGGTI